MIWRSFVKFHKSTLYKLLYIGFIAARRSYLSALALICFSTVGCDFTDHVYAPMTVRNRRDFCDRHVQTEAVARRDHPAVLFIYLSGKPIALL